MDIYPPISTEDVFRNELQQNERILWSAQPDPKIIFSKSDILFVPFSLMWGGFAIFWEAAALGFVFRTPKGQGPPLLFALWGVPFVLIGLYMIIGRFFYKAWRKKRTYYAVTDQRVIVLTTGLGGRSRTAFINTLPAISKSVGKNGVGTVVFGNDSFTSAMYANSGIDFLGPRDQQALCFFDIKDTDDVYHLVNRLRSEQTARG